MKDVPRHQAIREFLETIDNGGDKYEQALLINRFLEEYDRANPQVVCEPTLVVMRGKLTKVIMLREFMLVNSLTAALTDSIREPATDLYRRDFNFRSQVDSIVSGIMKVVEEYLIPARSGDVSVMVNLENDSTRLLLEDLSGDLAEVLTHYNLVVSGRHVDPEFTRVVFTHSQPDLDTGDGKP